MESTTQFGTGTREVDMMEEMKQKEDDVWERVKSYCEQLGSGFLDRDPSLKMQRTKELYELLLVQPGKVLFRYKSSAKEEPWIPVQDVERRRVHLDAILGIEPGMGIPKGKRLKKVARQICKLLFDTITRDIADMMEGVEDTFAVEQVAPVVKYAIPSYDYLPPEVKDLILQYVQGSIPDLFTMSRIGKVWRELSRERLTKIADRFAENFIFNSYFFSSAYSSYCKTIFKMDTRLEHVMPYISVLFMKDWKKYYSDLNIYDLPFVFHMSFTFLSLPDADRSQKFNAKFEDEIARIPEMKKFLDSAKVQRDKLDSKPGMSFHAMGDSCSNVISNMVEVFCKMFPDGVVVFPRLVMRNIGELEGESIILYSLAPSSMHIMPWGAIGGVNVIREYDSYKSTVGDICALQKSKSISLECPVIVVSTLKKWLMENWRLTASNRWFTKKMDEEFTGKHLLFQSIDVNKWRELRDRMHGRKKELDEKRDVIEKSKKRHRR